MEEILKHTEKPKTLSDIKNACKLVYGDDGGLVEICEVSKELEQGIDIVSKYPRVATIYGSARLKEDHEMYKAAVELSSKLVSELGFAVMTGGAGGIMAAANKGAKMAGGHSLGSTIRLEHEQVTNKDVTESIPFEHFFTRKTVLRYGSECGIFFPGGFGTFDELFELLTLIQTNKLQKIPVILFGTKFWSPLDSYIKDTLLNEFKTIGAGDENLYLITDDINKVIEIAASAPIKEDAGINEDEKS